MTYRKPRAIVWVPDREFQKLALGFLLPEGYELVEQVPITSPERMALGFLVESDDLPPTTHGSEYPSLGTLPGYQGIVARRWEDSTP